MLPRDGRLRIVTRVLRESKASIVSRYRAGRGHPVTLSYPAKCNDRNGSVTSRNPDQCRLWRGKYHDRDGDTSGHDGTAQASDKYG